MMVEQTTSSLKRTSYAVLSISGSLIFLISLWFNIETSAVLSIVGIVGTVGFAFMALHLMSYAPYTPRTVSLTLLGAILAPAQLIFWLYSMLYAFSGNMSNDPYQMRFENLYYLIAILLTLITIYVIRQIFRSALRINHNDSVPISEHI